MSENEQKKKEPFFTKSFWISFVISFVSATILGVLIGIIEWLTQEAEGYKFDPLAISLDAVSLSGILMFLFFLLQYLSTKGAFDFLAYALKVAVYTVFRPNFRKTGFPATYYDYKTLKDEENRKPILAILFVSTIFIVVGITIYIVYKTKL